MRKILGKKKVEQLPMLRRMMIWGMIPGKGPAGWKENENSPWYDEEGKYGTAICGGLALGYKREVIETFFTEIQGYASYCFNLGHSLSYAFNCLLSAFLKSHYPAQYMAAVLSAQETDKKKEQYLKVCESMGISIVPPDINQSQEGFTVIDKDTISYGLGAIKSVKDVSEILAGAPYKGIQDITRRLPRKIFNKRVAEAFIKAGAFDFENPNRKELLNQYISIRNQELSKNQREPLLENTTYDRLDCMEMEAETLGRSITYKPAWKGAMPGEPLSGNCTFKDIHIHITKTKHQKMAMLTVINETYEMPALLFPREYPRYASLLQQCQDKTKDAPDEVYFVKGCMNKEGDKLIINRIEPQKLEKAAAQKFSFIFNPMDF